MYNSSKRQNYERKNRGDNMVQTIIRVGSIILLFLIVTNIWTQKRARDEEQNKNSKKK